MDNIKARAAVAVIITECESPSVLLLKRAKNQNDPWSGQWAFPGGKREADDADLIDTSIRETYEECGCILSRDDMTMTLPLANAGKHSGHPVLVAPFLWKIKQKKELQLDVTEMEEARWQEIKTLNNDALHKNDLVISEYPEKRFPYITLDNVPLWGFTYGVLMKYLRTHDNAFK